MATARLESSALACCRWQKHCSTRSTSRAQRYSEEVPSGQAGGESELEAPATSCWTAAVSWPCGWPGLQLLSSSKDSTSRWEHATAKQASCVAAHLRHVGLQPPMDGVAASDAWGCSTPLRLGPCPDDGDELEAEQESRAHMKCASPPRLV